MNETEREFTMGQWAHDVAAQYRDLAANEPWGPRRAALEGAASNYDGIGRRMDRIGRRAPAPAGDSGDERG